LPPQSGYFGFHLLGGLLQLGYLLRHPQKCEEMGLKAKYFVRDNFLLTRHLREYLTLIAGLIYQKEGRIELG